MPKRSRRPTDPNLLAAAIVGEATGGGSASKARARRKNPAAVALGKLGGKKGGVARAKALTKEQRSEIARKAAQARWAVKT